MYCLQIIKYHILHGEKPHYPITNLCCSSNTPFLFFTQFNNNGIYQFEYIFQGKTNSSFDTSQDNIDIALGLLGGGQQVTLAYTLESDIKRQILQPGEVVTVKATGGQLMPFWYGYVK